eukprot:5863535-Amphidinium_carterae.1
MKVKSHQQEPPRYETVCWLMWKGSRWADALASSVVPPQWLEQLLRDPYPRVVSHFRQLSIPRSVFAGLASLWSRSIFCLSLAARCVVLMPSKRCQDSPVAVLVIHVAAAGLDLAETEPANALGLE